MNREPLIVPKTVLIFAFFAFLFSLSGENLLAQEENLSSCTQTLRNAQTTFEKGRIDLIPDMLAPCLTSESGFNKEDRIKAHKLLVNTYLYFNEREKAVASMTSFLRLAPEYKIDPVIDKSEFINLYNSFRTTPIYLFGGKVGLNYPHLNITKNFSIDDSSLERGKYTNQIGYQFGISAEFPILKNFSISPELYFQQKNYAFEDVILNFASISTVERQSWLELPLVIRYNFTGLRDKDITPFINFGAAASYLLTAEIEISREDDVVEEIQRTIDAKTIDVTALRTRLYYSAVLGAGVKIKNVIGSGYLLVDFKYNHGLLNLIEEDKRTSNPELLYKYLYMDNDYTMNTFSFSIGYLLPKYNPKILKSKKTKIRKKDKVSDTE